MPCLGVEGVEGTIFSWASLVCWFGLVWGDEDEGMEHENKNSSIFAMKTITHTHTHTHTVFQL